MAADHEVLNFSRLQPYPLSNTDNTNVNISPNYLKLIGLILSFFLNIQNHQD